MNEVFERQKNIDKDYCTQTMANNLKTLRAKCYLTQEDLCELVGVSR